MAFLDEIGKKITSAGQSTVQFTKDMTDVARLNSQIAEEETKQNTAYYQIGKLYFSKHQTDYEDDFTAMMNSIVESEKKIKDCRHQISVIKGIVVCPRCGAENPVGSAFCTSCGEAIPKEASPISENMRKCESCGAVVPKDSRFCTSCGKPMSMETV